MDAYVSKPVDARELIKAIESQLQHEPRPRATATLAPNPAVQLPPAKSITAAPLAVEELLHRCMGNASIALESLDEFEKQAVRELADLTSSIAGHDSGRAARVAHSLKGASSILSAEAVRRTAAELEKLGRSGDLSLAGTLLAQLQVEVRQCIEFLPTAREAISATVTSSEQQGN